MQELYLEIIIGVIVVIGVIGCLAMLEIPKRHYGYKELLLKESEVTKQESIKLAQKVAEREKEEEKTKQLQIKAEYKEKYNETLYSV